MLQAVERENAYIEGLRDRILSGNKRPPPDVPGPNVRPRLPNRPGDATPRPAGKIPASSQRPGKRVNETIPYGRMLFTNFQDNAGDPQDMLPGDIMMVHRAKDCVGKETNKASKAATWRQLNAVLEAGTVGGAKLGPGIPQNRLFDNRLQQVRALLERAETDLYAFVDNDDGVFRFKMSLPEREKEWRRRNGDPNPAAEPDLPDDADPLDKAINIVQRRAAVFEREKQDLFQDARLEKRFQDRATRSRLLPMECDQSAMRDLLRDLKDEVFMPAVDWRVLPALVDWTPDGVLMSRDDDEHNADWFRGESVNLGVMLNIAVQGYAVARNAARAKISQHPYEFEQLIDPMATVRDTLLLLLVCKTNVDADKKFVNFSYYYRPTSRRILEEHVQYQRKHPGADPDRAVAECCVTLREVRSTVAAWNLGTVMDNRLVSNPEAKLAANVAIYEIPMCQLLLMVDPPPLEGDSFAWPTLGADVPTDVPFSESASGDTAAATEAEAAAQAAAEAEAAAQQAAAQAAAEAKKSKKGKAPQHDSKKALRGLLEDKLKQEGADWQAEKAAEAEAAEAAKLQFATLFTDETKALVNNGAGGVVFDVIVLYADDWTPDKEARIEGAFRDAVTGYFKDDDRTDPDPRFHISGFQLRETDFRMKTRLTKVGNAPQTLQCTLLLEGNEIRSNPAKDRKMYKTLNDRIKVAGIVNRVFGDATQPIAFRATQFPVGRDGAFQRALHGLEFILPLGRFKRGSNGEEVHDNLTNTLNTVKWDQLVIRRSDPKHRKGLAILAWQTDRWYPVINECRRCSSGEWKDTEPSFVQNVNKWMDAAVLAFFCPWDKLRRNVPLILEKQGFEGEQLQRVRANFFSWKQRDVRIRRAEEANNEPCAVKPMLVVPGSETKAEEDSKQFERWMDLVATANNKDPDPANERLDSHARELYALALEEINAALFDALVQLDEPVLVWRGLKRMSSIFREERLQTEWNATTFKKDVAEEKFMTGATERTALIEAVLQPGAWVVPTTKLIPNEWLCFSLEGELLLPPGLKWERTGEGTLDYPKTGGYLVDWKKASYMQYIVEQDPTRGKPRSGRSGGAGPSAP